MISYDEITVEFEFSTGVWTNVYQDVIEDIFVSQGIRGSGPLDRVATTGTCKLTLKSDAGKYIPGHSGCQSGFEKGTAFKITIQYTAFNSHYWPKFYGKINKITPRPSGGIHYLVDVEIVDFIDSLASQELIRPAFAENQRMSDIVNTIQTSLPITPLYIKNNTTQSVFPTAFDTTRPYTKALQEISKATISELGFVFVSPKWDAAPGSPSAELETLYPAGRFQFEPSTNSISLTDENISSIGLDYGTNYFNEIKTIVYPRRADSAATSILFSAKYTIQLLPGNTISIKGSFKDPNQEAVSVSGIDMIDPAPNTDYIFNTQEDGGGSDITSDLDVSADYGTNGVLYELTNNNASIGYITKLQARGKGVYVYRPIEYSAEYSAGIAADGRKTLSVPLVYQSDPNIGKSFADALLNIYKTKAIEVKSVTFEINQSSTFANWFRAATIGEVVNIDSDDLDVDKNFLFLGWDFVIRRSGFILCKLYLLSEDYLPGANFWKLGVSGKSTLDSTTILGF